MNNIYLSKTGYCKLIQCNKIFWLNRYRPDLIEKDEDNALFAIGRKVGQLAKGLFGKYHDVPYDSNLATMIEETSKLMQQKPNIITEASFTYDNNFCSVDILKNDSDGVEIYEVKSSTGIKEVYYDDAAYQYYVLSNLGLNVKRVSIVYINKNYVRNDEFELEKLFKVGDITGQVIEKQNEIRYNIQSLNTMMQNYDENNEPPVDIGLHCSTPYHCDYWEYCTRNLPKPNVFDLIGQQETKFEKYYEGKVGFEDLENDEGLSEKQLEQIDFELYDRKAKIDKTAIKQLVDSLRYPLYFIDYETFQSAIPEIKNTRPYQQLPFQYSLHIIKEPGTQVEHREFLAQADDKDFIRHFAESMIRDISEDGSVIIYSKFERSINNSIAQLYPDLKEELDRINGNMVDFMSPFQKRQYYTRQMKGYHSIKYVLPALYPDNPELDYKNLSLIHRGDEAAEAFSSLKDKTSEEQEKIRQGLLEYCKLDTLAMVRIYEKFLQVIDE